MAIPQRSHSPPVTVEDMEKEIPCMSLWDADLPPASGETGSRLSISTIVDAMCCVRHMAEDTLGLTGTSRLNDALTRTNMFDRRKRVGNILGEIGHVPKIYSIKSPAGPVNLSSTPQRRENESALPLSVTSETNKGQGVIEKRGIKSSSRSCSPDLYKLLEISCPWNSAQQCCAVESYNSNKNSEELESTVSFSDSSEDDLSDMEDTTSHSKSASVDARVEAETEKPDSTIRVSYTSLGVVLFLQDANCKQIPEPHDDVKVTSRISASSDMNEIDLQFDERIHDTIYSMVSANNRNIDCEDDKGIAQEESPPPSSKDQPREMSGPSKKKQGRQIRHLFYSSFCCLSTPKKGDTTPRPPSTRCPYCNSPVSEVQKLVDYFLSQGMFQASKTHLDELQIKRLEEMCIVIDKQDKIIGADTKKNCHLMENIDKGLLHRGFSVVLFNTKNQLLVQQRTDAKYTFPGHFTDSCSSHPLYVPEEMEEEDAVGVSWASPRTSISIKDIIFMTRKYHKCQSDAVWGEHEIGYLLLVRKDLTLCPDSREVKAYRYMSQEDTQDLLAREARGEEKITPWFRSIVEDFLFPLWPHLEDVSPFVEPDKIYGL
ncbi:Isopentenyl-diphosphate delta-isomerase 2 [Apodemus speciosus]|uniref:isopentenyl-diphosphate Delta-isomerase n=1 Tax=Apodemus speciosus TaxID=105296 RepID=A0ABQ0FF91_APOSI